jgi:hypothetical protein
MIYTSAYLLLSIGIAVWAVHDDKEIFEELSIYPDALFIAVVVIGCAWPLMAAIATYRWITQPGDEAP